MKSRSLYVRMALIFITIVIICMISAFFLLSKLYEKQVTEQLQQGMLDVGHQVVAALQETPVEDWETFQKGFFSGKRVEMSLYQVEGNGSPIERLGQGIVKVGQEEIESVLKGNTYYAIQQDQLATATIGLPVQKGSETLATGDFAVQVPIKRHDEIGQLAQSFNEMASDLQQIERMRREFVSNVSHEIQSPLHSIRGFSVPLRSGMVPESDRNRTLEIIQTESERLSCLSENRCASPRWSRTIIRSTRAPMSWRLSFEMSSSVVSRNGRKKGLRSISNCLRRRSTPMRTNCARSG